MYFDKQSVKYMKKVLKEDKKRIINSILVSDLVK